jgi:nucleoside-diphosphate-sugar epimerase
VTALVRRAGGEASLRKLGCHIVYGDLANAPARFALLAGADVVYHLAGLVQSPSLAKLRRVNRDGAARLARDAAAAGVSRFLLVSSQAVTGPSPRGVSIDEASGPGPVTDYGRSKQDGEAAVREVGLPVTVVRPSAVYGPGDRAFLPLFRLAARGLVPLPGDGEQELSLVFAPDLVHGLIAAAESRATLGGTYHAAHAEVVTARGFGETLGRARAVELPGAVLRGVLRATSVLGIAGLPMPDKTHELLAPAWRASCDAILRDAGWRAETDHERGVAATVAAYRDAGWL